MTDSILRSYGYQSITTMVPFPFVPPIPHATLLLDGETQGFAIDATTYDAYTPAAYPGGPVGGTVSVKDTGTPANNLVDVALDNSNLTQSGTSPKMVSFSTSPFLRWTPHNMFLNSGAPATQSVTVVTGFVYTVTVTGSGSLAGTSGASGTATAGSPVTFTATGTTATWTLTGSLTTIQMNRGTVATPYLATTGSIRIGIPQEYDSAAGKYGILAEPAATNLILFSDALDNAAYSVSGVSVSANTTAGPDGSVTADSIIEDSSTGSHQIYQGVLAQSGINTCSGFLKQGSGTHSQYVYFELANGGGASGGYGVFDLVNGVITQSALLGVGTNLATSMTSFGNGWYQCVVTANPSQGGGNTYPALIMCNSATPGGRPSYTGDGTSFVYSSGLQFESGSVATSYIPTVGSTVTRAADIISAVDSTFPGSDTTISVYLDYKPLVVSSGSRYAWAYWKDTNNFMSLLDSTADPIMGNNQASVADVATDLGTLVASTRTQVSIACKGNDFDGSQNGAAVSTDSTATLTTGYTTLYLGTFGTTGSELNGYIYRMVFVPRQVQADGSNLATWRYNF